MLRSWGLSPQVGPLPCLYYCHVSFWLILFWNNPTSVAYWKFHLDTAYQVYTVENLLQNSGNSLWKLTFSVKSGFLMLGWILGTGSVCMFNIGEQLPSLAWTTLRPWSFVRWVWLFLQITGVVGIHMNMLAIWWDGDCVSLGSFAQNTKVMLNLLNWITLQSWKLQWSIIAFLPNFRS